MRVGKYFAFCEKRGLLPVLWEEDVWLQWDGMNGPFRNYGRKAVAGVWLDDEAIALGEGQFWPSDRPNLGEALNKAATKIESLERDASHETLLSSLRAWQGEQA